MAEKTPSDKPSAGVTADGRPRPYEVGQHVVDGPDEVKGVAPDIAGGDVPTPTSGADTTLATDQQRKDEAQKSKP